MPGVVPTTCPPEAYEEFEDAFRKDPMLIGKWVGCSEATCRDLIPNSAPPFDIPTTEPASPGKVGLSPPDTTPAPIDPCSEGSCADPP